MRDPISRVRGSRASGRGRFPVDIQNLGVLVANNGALPTGDDSASIQNGDGERAAATPPVDNTVEAVRPGATSSAFGPGCRAVRFADDGIPIVDVESNRVVEARPFVRQKEESQLKGDVVHKPYSFERTTVIDGIVRNLTQRARLPRRTRLRVEDLANANRRKDEFLAMLGHELRSPLASINTAVFLLGSQTEETPRRQRAQALLERQVRRMTQLVDDLLDVSRITHGHLRLQRLRVDLRVVVGHAIEAIESDINERRHRLATALPDAPVWLAADAGRLEQVFVNLLGNASKYTDAGGDLAIWVHTTDGQAVVRVRDTGMGIAADVLPQIFDLFKQADEAAPRSGSGLGVGLAVVRSLVELHGGSVTAVSAGLGQGSEFTVRLPLGE